ncbi:RNA polymerase factor sigma-54 [Luteimonas sp. RIT-PG2_3]
MKPRLQTSLGQQLVLTPQLRQALHLLQLSTLELEAEITAAIESNPLLDWEEGDDTPDADPVPGERETLLPEREPLLPDRGTDTQADTGNSGDAEWDPADDSWYDRSDYVGGNSGGDHGDDDQDPGNRLVQTESLQDHLSWQLHLSHLSPRDRQIGAALIDAIDDDGYLRESFDAIASAVQPESTVGHDEILAVLRQVQCFDPVGVGARDLGECLVLQLDNLPEDTPGRRQARRAAAEMIDRLPRLGASGLADALGCSPPEAAEALQLLRSLDPRPGAQIGGVPTDNYVTPDCTISRVNGVWRVALANSHQARLTIHRGYEQMIQHASGEDGGYLRGRLQEARWLLKNIEARGETLLKVVRCVVHQQSGFLEFGASALRPLTLREVATQIGMHESTVSRAVSRKFVHTPRGTLPLRDFFASGIDTDSGGGASSTAIQQMIRELISAEAPRKPLSDARIADLLKASGIPLARRTVTKYREAMNIPSSHERVRVG